MFRRHPLKWIVAATVAGIWLWLRFRTVPVLPGDHLQAGVLALAAKEYSVAAQHFREELKVVPQQLLASEELAALLIRAGRSWEAAPYVRTALTQQKTRQDYLVLFSGDPDQSIDETMLNEWHRQSPEDATPLTGLARIALRSARTDDARRLLEGILASSPHDVEAHVVKGLVELAANPAGLHTWNKQLPPGAELHPGIWYVRGDWCQQADDRQMAIRCFLQGVRLNADDRGLSLRLGQLLGKDKGQPFLDRAETLRMTFNAAAQLKKGSSATDAWSIALSLSALGRTREASQWGQVAMVSDSQMMRRMVSDRAFGDQYRQVIGAGSSGTNSNPALRIDLKAFPEWQPPAESAVNPRAVANRKIRFADDSWSVGLDFVYDNAADPTTEGQRMQEFTGGGVGVLDVDHDSWPDMFFPQGCVWPPGTDGKSADQLYRNLRGVSFRNSTAAAGVGDTGFSQGVTVADFNSDGFDDFYLGNIGPNRLYLNHGDGTFTETSGLAGMADDDWTSSCAAGDFNGDSLPDLFVVNYLTGKGVFETICENQNVKVTCNPSSFESAPDRLLINLGDGRFEDQSTVAGIRVSGGAGLGVIAAHLDSDSRLDIFVANDQQPNFCFLNVSDPGSLQCGFREQGVNVGLAFDREGKAQACMGVALGFLNGDEFPDMLVTNFSNESNTLYLSHPSGVFSDASLASGLARPSLPMLGFGTAFLDADLDGQLDLVVANGHIGDHRMFGEQYRMRPQFFSNIGTRSVPEFAELRLTGSDSYFESELLGRGLAVLDWNRDGLPDFCVSHLETSAALLTNGSAEVGNFLSLRLCGVNSARDAVGTRIRVLVGGRTAFFALTGGGSFESSNQRIVLCGLGAAERIEELQIRWPSGEDQIFRDLPANETLVAVEGRLSLVSEPH